MWKRSTSSRRCCCQTQPMSTSLFCTARAWFNAPIGCSGVDLERAHAGFQPDAQHEQVVQDALVQRTVGGMCCTSAALCDPLVPGEWMQCAGYFCRRTWWAQDSLCRSSITVAETRGKPWETLDLSHDCAQNSLLPGATPVRDLTKKRRDTVEFPSLPRRRVWRTCAFFRPP